MVEYFGQQLSGYVFSQFGWVQSYGSRCVKPPIIFEGIGAIYCIEYFIKRFVCATRPIFKLEFLITLHACLFLYAYLPILKAVWSDHL
jgi:hypothetical protein